jgi:PTS system nitrogen regulatory IIA component
MNHPLRDLLDRGRGARSGDGTDDHARRIGAWLQPQAVLLDVAATDGRQVLKVAADEIGRMHDFTPTLIFDALWRREQAGSTSLGEGFAIPHARIGAVREPFTLYLRTRAPVDFAARDGRPVGDLLVILVPSDGAADDHLQLLALVARLFSDRRFRKGLHGADDAAAVTTAFRDGIERALAHGG